MAHLAILFVLAAAMSGGDAVLVTTQQLAAMEDALIVDTRPKEIYAKGHIAGAINLDVQTLSETRDGVYGMLKHLPEVTRLLAKAGIDPTKPIVAYGDATNSDLFTFAPRMFWILEYMGYPRVSVLDGGFEKWKAEGRKTKKRATKADPVNLDGLVPQPGLLASRAQVEEILAKKDGVLADARSIPCFTGEKKLDYVTKSGHISGAINIPFTGMLVPPGNSHLVMDAVRGKLAASGVDGSRPIIVYCNSGGAAAALYLAFRRASISNVSVYDGSMAEWAASGGLVESTAPAG